MTTQTTPTNEMKAFKLHPDKPFIVYDKTPIKFGKLRDQCHSVLLDEKNSGYVKWLLNTEPDFAAPTKTWLKTKI
jgi:hypothetical protein